MFYAFSSPSIYTERYATTIGDHTTNLADADYSALSGAGAGVVVDAGVGAGAGAVPVPVSSCSSDYLGGMRVGWYD